MYALLLMLAAAVLVPAAGFCQEPAPKVGTVVFETGFEGPDALKGWSGGAKLEPGFQGGQAVAIENKAGGGVIIQLPLPVEKMRGCLIHFSAMVKAEGVSQKPQSWNGIKFMTPYDSDGAKGYPQAPLGTGTFDWQRALFPVRVPPQATAISLFLGLEAVTGKVWFDDIKVTIRKPPLVIRPRKHGGPVYRGHSLPRLRGAMVSFNIDEAGLRAFGQEWNANLIRWQFANWQPKGTDLDLAAYDAWLDAHIQRLDAALPLCEKYGLKVVVDLHGAPGGTEKSGKGLFTDARCQAKLVEVWERLARHYKGARAVWGYDILNEPMENAVAEDVLDWQELVEKTARAIHAIDPGHAIIVEPTPGGDPSGLRTLQPLDLPNVVYSVHMYLPHAFTHQGVFGSGKPYVYPGEIDGRKWNKAALEAALQPVVAFQKTHGVHIYIGEFSAIRWAPDDSACRYLKDLIDIFEANGWDWSYHAFREWSGWSVEHGSDRNNNAPAEQPTDRQKLLCEWFAKNRKP